MSFKEKRCEVISMTLTWSQMVAVFGAGVLFGAAGLIGLLGSLTARYDDKEGGCFAHAIALLTAAAALALLIVVFR